MISIKKTEFTTDLTEFLNEATLVRNKKGKSYSYVALLSNYQSSKNIDRNFIDKVTDFEISQNGWSLCVSTTFLNKLKVGDIVEVKANVRKSGKYSYSSSTYLVVVNNSDEILQVLVEKTPFQAFKISK